jgi:nanoRNase/pAp phosphatase (c-di-AMP/oligoRNAs hydrolase)
MSNNTSDYSKLYSFLLSCAKEKKNVAIFCHDSPDPDAMASALAFQTMAIRAKIKANIYYDGEINHSQNRAMINVLDINMVKISDLANGFFDEHLLFVEKSILVIVDTSNFSKGNCLGVRSFFKKEGDKKPNVIIDHHGCDVVGIDFVLNKPFGSCSTIMTKAMIDSNTKIDKRLATALYHGLMSDSDGMKNKENLSEEDHEVHDFLQDKIDLDNYMRIVNCPKSRILIDLEGRAKQKYMQQTGNSVVSGVGFINSAHRALLGEISDNLMRYDQVKTAVVLGIVDSGLQQPKYLVISFRNVGDILDSNEFIKKILGKENSGGRKGTAGGQIELSDVLNRTIDELDDDQESKENLFSTIFKAYSKFIFNELKIST